MDNNSYSIEKDINDILGDRISAHGEEEHKEYAVPVAASELLEYMAKELYFAVSEISMKELSFTEKDVIDAFKDVLEGRIAYVSGRRYKTHPKDVEYPAMLGPILAGIGVYHDEVANVTIIPSSGSKATSQDYQAKTLQTISKLRAFGVPTVFGLPITKTIETDDIYRLECADGIIRGANRVPPSPTTIFTRAMLKMTYLMDLYGEARVSYSAVKRLERGVHDLIMKNVNRPRIAFQG